jgi:hypothetical protein
MLDSPRTSLLLGSLLAVLALDASAQVKSYSLPGATTGDDFGYAVAVVGDHDGDGGRDFVVGLPGWSGGFGAYSGWSDLRSGADGSVIQGYIGGVGDLHGTSVAALGDVDSDGIEDWIVGSPQVGVRGSGWTMSATGPGHATVFSGASGLMLRTHTGISWGDAFGFSVAGGRDVDLDGVQDYVIGAPVESAAYLFSGASGALIRKIAAFNPETGYAVALTASVNGDANADVVVGAPGAFFNNGRVACFSGATGALLWTSLGVLALGNEMGWALAAPGDLNGDGVADVIAGDREWGNSLGASGEGRAFWLNGTNGAKLGAVVGTQFAGARGTSLAVLGDLDGDGVPEIAVGAPGLSDGTTFTPADDLLIVSGATRAVVSRIEVPASQPQAFAWALAGADLDADGLDDLLVGTPREDGLQPSAGTLTAYTVLSDPVVYCTSQVNSLGCVPNVHWTGTPSFAASTFRVGLSNTLNQKFGLLFWGPGTASVPMGGGTLCLASPVTRTPGQLSGGTPPPAQDCSGAFGYHFDSGYLAANGLVAGTTVGAQYWSRDPAAPSGFHLSDAVLFTVLP